MQNQFGDNKPNTILKRNKQDKPHKITAGEIILYVVVSLASLSIVLISIILIIKFRIKKENTIRD